MRKRRYTSTFRREQELTEGAFYSLMAKTEVLPEKYRKALQLIEAGNHSYREIARLCVISEQSFYDLIEGNAKDNPNIQALFSAELSILQKRRDKEIRDLIKKNKKTTHYLIDNWLTDQKRRKKVSNSLMPMIVSVANAISKFTPNVEIGSFVYQKGLSPEDIYGEFKRLTSIASHGGAVPGATPGGTGEISLSPRPRVAAAQESEDSVLPAEPETEGLPPIEDAG